MIVGLGNDLCEIVRVERTLARYGERFTQRCFTEVERRKSDVRKQRAASYAKRFAAKEALGKALGSGIRAPLLLPSIAVTHDAAGKPAFQLDAGADALVAGRGRIAHLSISDEQDYAIAFVVLEQT